MVTRDEIKAFEASGYNHNKAFACNGERLRATLSSSIHSGESLNWLLEASKCHSNVTVFA